MPAGWSICGVIEGFYGQPWTWEERRLVGAACAKAGLTDYVYAPKDDPKHRERWQEPYDDDEIAGFRSLVDDGDVRVGFAISPGLTIDATSSDHLAQLGAKVDQALDVGVGLVVLAVDDIPFGGAPQGAEHARLTTWLADYVGERAEVAMVPTEYVGDRPSPYLTALAEGLPEEVAVGWTGMTVVCDEITAEAARRRGSALGGRPPLVWDNVPVNDGLMAELLRMEPLRGRDPGLLEPGVCSGWLANAMNQPRASLPTLTSIGAWAAGDDADAAFEADVEVRGWRRFAEACDGVVPRALVADLAGSPTDDDALAAAHAWFAEAATCEAPGLEAEAGRWLDQVHEEAELALAALELLTGEGGFGATLRTFGLVGRWRRVRRADPQVMGARIAMLPVLGQAPDGSFALRPGAVVDDTNAVDALVRLALHHAGAL